MRRHPFAHLAGLCALALASSAPALADRMGTHGMLIFGGEATYASHLPMWHPPHDAQILLELTSDMPGCQPRSADGVYTLQPEPFDLDRLAPDAAQPLESFRAKLYQGHFERGGQLVMPDCSFRIARVLHFAWLDPAHSDGPPDEYLVFGRGNERFLVRPIGGSPDRDHILRWTGFKQPPTTDRIRLLKARRDGQLVQIHDETNDLQ